MMNRFQTLLSILSCAPTYRAATDSLAGALKATGPPQLSPPIASVGPRPIVKAYYNADELLRRCPPALAAAAGRVGWGTIDMIWCTLLAMEGCKQNGLAGGLLRTSTRTEIGA
jgi:hypothetical protein